MFYPGWYPGKRGRITIGMPVTRSRQTREHWHLPPAYEFTAATIRRPMWCSSVIVWVPSMALKTASALLPEEGRVFVVTLDPSDRSYIPVRPAAVCWWGNAYVANSRSAHDYIAVWGGRWNCCKQADVNLRFDGRMQDESGYPYIHDNALSLMCSRGRGRHASLFDELCRRLRTESESSPEGDMSRLQLPEEREDTK